MARLRLLLVAALVLAPALASAHIALDFPLPRTTEQKLRHCGAPTIPRGTPNVFLPGQTITVRWRETVNHLGWYRLSFQQNGDTFEIPLGGGGPCGDASCGTCVGSNTCNFPVEDLTGMVDPTQGTGSLIIADRIPDGTLSFDITFPNVECDNCTLQLIQVMSNGHGAYDETLTVDGNDVYFQCADITLSAGTPDAAPPGPPDADPGNPGNPDAGVGGGETGGGCCSTSGGSSGTSSGILTALSLVGLLVRRRRRV